MTDRIPTACDSDPARQALLAAALATDAVKAAAEAFRPQMNPDDPASPLDPTWQPGPFEYAAAVRQNLPDGLAATDFDGVNVQAALTPAGTDPAAPTS